MLLKSSPGPWLVLPSEEVKWGDNVGEVRDEFVIEIHESKERVYTLDGGGGFPFLDGRELDRVHLNLSQANDHAKEFNARDIEGTLGEFEGQSVFSEAKQNTSSTFVVECEITLGVNA